MDQVKNTVPNQKMSISQFEKNFYRLQAETPSYRLGQYFITLFIKRETDSRLDGLWEEKDPKVALKRVYQYCQDMNWDLESLLVVRDVDSKYILSDEFFSTTKKK